MSHHTHRDTHICTHMMYIYKHYTQKQIFLVEGEWPFSLPFYQFHEYIVYFMSSFCENFVVFLKRITILSWKLVKYWINVLNPFSELGRNYLKKFNFGGKLPINPLIYGLPMWH